MRHLQDEWLAIAGHELGTPIAPLQGSLQLTLRNFDIKKNPPVFTRIERSLGQVSGISQLIDQMVQATRFQYGRITFTFGEFDLVALIDDTVESASAQRGTARITFNHPDGQASIDGDPDRLRQALLNLLSNTILHSQDEVEVDITLTADAESIRLAIADDGPGIPTEALSTIWGDLAGAAVYTPAWAWASTSPGRLWLPMAARSKSVPTRKQARPLSSHCLIGTP